MLIQRMLNDWASYCNNWAETKGWNEKEIPVMESFALFVTEIAEAIEEYRAGHSPTEIYFDDVEFVNIDRWNNESGHDPKPEGIPIEIADVLIRIFHFAGYHGIDLEEAVSMKMAYNQNRPYRHGGKLA